MQKNCKNNMRETHVSIMNGQRYCVRTVDAHVIIIVAPNERYCQSICSSHNLQLGKQAYEVVPYYEGKRTIPLFSRNELDDKLKKIYVLHGHETDSSVTKLAEKMTGVIATPIKQSIKSRVSDYLQKKKFDKPVEA